MSEGVSVDKLVKIYIKMRDKRSVLKREYEKEDLEVEDSMKLITAQLLELCKELGASGLKTAYGTVSRTTKTYYWTNDWPEMRKFMKEHDVLDLTEQRLHQTNMKTFLENNPELLPPGLNADSTYDVSIRRK